MEHGDARFATASLPVQHADAMQKTSGFNYAELRDLQRALYSRQTHVDFGINHGSVTLAGKERFTTPAAGSPLLIVSDKSRHFLQRWPTIPWVTWGDLRITCLLVNQTPTCQRLGPLQGTPNAIPITLIRIGPRGAAGERSLLLRPTRCPCAWFTSRHFQVCFCSRNRTWQGAPDKRKIEPEAEGAARDGPPQSIPVASMSKPGPSTR